MNIEKIKLIYLTIPLYTREQYKDLVEKACLDTYGEKGKFDRIPLLDEHTIIIDCDDMNLVDNLIKHIYDIITPDMLLLPRLVMIYDSGSVETLLFGYDKEAEKVSHRSEYYRTPYRVNLNEEEAK